jgi:hypothetical protein
MVTGPVPVTCIKFFTLGIFLAFKKRCANGNFILTGMLLKDVLQMKITGIKIENSSAVKKTQR